MRVDGGQTTLVHKDYVAITKQQNLEANILVINCESNLSCAVNRLVKEVSFFSTLHDK